MAWIATPTAAPGVYVIAEDDDQRTLVGTIKTRAKADLAASAPTLLEALEKCRRIMTDGILNSPFKDVEDAVRTMHAAIAKARGEAK